MHSVFECHELMVVDTHHFLVAVKQSRRHWEMDALLQSGNIYGVDFERLLPQLKRLILVGNLRTHADNPIIAIDHMGIDLQDDLITRSDEPELNRIFVWDNP